MFLPPECCSFEVNNYSMKKADVWALGVTIYCLVFNKLPFEFGKTDLDIMDKISNTRLSYDTRTISDELK